MQGLESIGSAMWFIQPLLVGLLMFCSIRHLGLKFIGWKREFVVTILVMAIYIFGLTIIRTKVTLEYYADIAMVVLPIIYIGFLTDKIWNYIPLKWYFGLSSVLIMISIYKITGATVDLSSKQIIGPIWFILASISGIYFNLVLAKIIQRSQKIGDLIAYTGERSFHIMALHFLAFKIVSLLYVTIKDKPYFWIAMFPTIDSKWWVIYSIVGVFGSLAGVKFFLCLKLKCEKGLKMIACMSKENIAK